MRSTALTLSLWLGIATQPAGAGGIDHKLSYDNSGIWQHSTQKAVEYSSMGAVVGTALWDGADGRVGKASWQAVDATLIGTLASEALKRIATRVRPTDTDNPDLWFQGGSNHSFPSGEVTAMAAMVTPYVLEYGHDYPAVYALELLPAYIGVGRMKLHAHWQTDVIAGFALGTGTGYFSHRLSTPLTVQVLPHGLTVGIKKSF